LFNTKFCAGGNYCIQVFSTQFRVFFQCPSPGLNKRSSVPIARVRGDCCSQLRGWKISAKQSEGSKGLRLYCHSSQSLKSMKIINFKSCNKRKNGLKLEERQTLYEER